MPERGEKSHGLPVTPGGLGKQRLTFPAPTMGRGHIGLGPGLINEDKTAWVQSPLIFLPLLAAIGYIRPSLLAGEYGFF